MKKNLPNFRSSGCVLVVCDHLQLIVVVSRPDEEIFSQTFVIIFLSVYFSSATSKHTQQKQTKNQTINTQWQNINVSFNKKK